MEKTAFSRRSAASFAADLERALHLRLSDRRFWLLTGCGSLVSLMLTLVQIRTESLDTFELLARLLLVVESTLVLTALFLASSPWQPDGSQPAVISRVARGASGLFMLPLQYVVLALPLLLLHAYPDLAAQGIRVPLMLLQKGMLLLACSLILYSLNLGLVLQLRLPRIAALAASLISYLAASYAMTRLSLTNDVFSRLNDLFYWNQLSKHVMTFPHMELDRWTHNFASDWLVWYFLLFGAAAAIMPLLWLPAAALRDSRETFSHNLVRDEDTAQGLD